MMKTLAIALACGAVRPDGRVERVACAVGLAPYGPGGLPHEEWIAGLTSENVQEIEWALDGEEALARGLTARQADLAERLAPDPASLFGDDVPDVVVCDPMCWPGPVLAARWQVPSVTSVTSMMPSLRPGNMVVTARTSSPTSV